MVARSMAYTSAHQDNALVTYDDGVGMMDDILRKIEGSSQETLLWDKPSPQEKIAEKRASFMLNTHRPTGIETRQNIAVSSPINHHKKELVILWNHETGNVTNEHSFSGVTTAEYAHPGVTIAERTYLTETAAEYAHPGVTTAERTYLTETATEYPHPGVTTAEQTYTHPGLVTADENNNNVFAYDKSYLEPSEDFVTGGKCNSRLVRRRSSVDSGIIVRTPSEKNQDRERLVVIKSPLRRCKTSYDLIENKASATLVKSNSLPNLQEIDNTKFEPIDFTAYQKHSRRQDEETVIDNPVPRSNTFFRSKETKNLFNLKNYIDGRYQKEKLSDLIKRNNTFSIGAAKSPTQKFYSKDEEFHSNDEEEGEISVREEFVLTFDVNSKDQRGDTCLHYASSKGDVDTIQYLLKNGGNVWVKNKDRLLPMEMSRDFKTAKLLSQATIFYTEPEKHRKDCNVSSTVKLAFDL